MASGRTHLSIGDVLALVQAEFPDITISKIRFLESQGLLDPERTPSGYRKFYERDIERLRWILTQQRDHFLPLKVIRERLDEWDDTGEQPSLGVSGHPAGHAARRDAARATVSAIEAGIVDGPDDTAPGVVSAAGESSEPVGDGEPQVVDVPDSSDEAPAPPASDAADEQPTETAAGGSDEGWAGTSFDPRRAASELAASTAIEVTPEADDEPSGADDPIDDASHGPTPGADDGDAGADDAAGSGPARADVPAGTWFNERDDDAAMTAEELALRAGVPVSVVAELEGFSLISSSRVGPDAYYDVEALRVVKATKAFLDHGIEVRHLRMYKIAAEREAGVFAQLVVPLLKQRNPDARRRAEDIVGELATVGEELHAFLLRAALSETFG